MKSVLFVAVSLLVVGLSLQLPELKNCPPGYVPPSSVQNSCGSFTCDGRNKISGVGCSTWDCTADKHLGYKEADNSKPYPDCCGGPICAD